MADKVQKIRKEVARIQLYTQSGVLKQILDYIDKVQKEPVSEQNLSNVQRTVKEWKEEPIIEVLDRYLDRVPDEEVLKTKIAINEWFNVYFPKLQEEPVSIDFEQELYKAFGQVKDFTLGMRIAKWFYDMGKNSQEPVSEELERAADKEASDMWDKMEGEYDIAHDNFIAGAEWQKNKMMEDATDVTVHTVGDYPYIPQIELYDYDKDVPLAKEGDKLKIIVVRED